MIERNISLASTGSARTSGCDNQLRLGYSRNRGIYRLNITQTGEWEGMTIRALWHTERGMLVFVARGGRKNRSTRHRDLYTRVRQARL